MKKSLFPALVLSVIATSALSLNAEANNYFDDSKDIQVTAEVHPMIKINGLPGRITFNENSWVNDLHLTEYVNFTIGRRGPDSESSHPYTVTISSNESQGRYYMLENGNEKLPMTVDLYDEENTLAIMENGQKSTVLQTSESINSTANNAQLVLAISKTNYNAAVPGNYTANLTMLVEAE